VTNDPSKTVIAELRERYDASHQREVFLEVVRAGFAMIDTIVASLVYVETRRRLRQHSGGYGDGGGDGGGSDGSVGEGGGSD